MISLMDLGSGRRRHKTYDYADNTNIVVLYPSGEFAQVSGTLLRDKETGHLSLCEGCGS